jgi:hypothetical protein
MNEITREFIEIAYKAMQKAYWHQSNGMTDNDSEMSKKVGDALQMIGDLSRMQ